jgi:hypothetical protein
MSGGGWYGAPPLTVRLEGWGRAPAVGRISTVGYRTPEGVLVIPGAFARICFACGFTAFISFATAARLAVSVL